jgi:hypothetical protein
MNISKKIFPDIPSLNIQTNEINENKKLSRVYSMNNKINKTVLPLLNIPIDIDTEKKEKSRKYNTNRK